MVDQLIQHDRIVTTMPRAKVLRKFADRMVTLAKEVGVAGTARCCISDSTASLLRIPSPRAAVLAMSFAQSRPSFDCLQSCATGAHL